MNDKSKSLIILMADDDPDDRLMVEEAFEENHMAYDLRFVYNGQELMDYLNGTGRFSGFGQLPRPDLIILDVNMPKKDGFEALQEIKTDRQLCSIPVIIFTSSRSDEDIIRSYNLGVNSFINKPVSFKELVELIGAFGKYWFEIVLLPVKEEKECRHDR